MPRKRPHDRLDKIADAATEIFIQHGFAGAKISQVAALAGVGPGTIYLYAESKAGLFDLAVRRALEDPTVWSLALPHPTPAPGAAADAPSRCLPNPPPAGPSSGAGPNRLRPTMWPGRWRESSASSTPGFTGIVARSSWSTAAPRNGPSWPDCSIVDSGGAGSVGWRSTSGAGSRNVGCPRVPIPSRQHTS